MVTQSNHLVEARYNLPLAEQRIILTMIARIQPDDEDFKPYHISIKELAEFMGIDKNSAYRECKKITHSLLTRVIEIAEPGRVLQVGWVSSAEYIEGSGTVNLSFDPLLKPYLLSLKGNFTSLKLEMILKFKSQYSVRLYSLLKQYHGFKNHREVQIDTLREMLGLTKDTHKAYSDLKANILRPVQKELSEKADVYFDMDEIRMGRRVVAVRFNIHSRDIPKTDISQCMEINAEVNQMTSDLDELILLVPESHRTKKTVLAALDSYLKKLGVDYVKRNIAYANVKSDKSYAGFLTNALRHDWGHDWLLEQNAKELNNPMEVWQRRVFQVKKNMIYICLKNTWSI
ncbi:replication initiation protein [Methylocucumis oryzae]|uniref:replication initiation protein n=1 Tax=Methylocucumis oryzae TaxID=1632867 RepID=UPI0009E5C431|nr:replication initiation protein [Methylocucumis oryzae]